MAKVSECMITARSVGVLSDTHVGAGNSVLDDASNGGYETLREFLRRNRVEVDVFVLLGDIFDLSLATYAETVASASNLIAVLSEFCEQIIYVPGNHDHHLAQLVSEEQQVVLKFPRLDPQLTHAEHSYAHSFLNHITGAADGKRFSVSYPNAYWEPPRDGRGVYVFHHGHFCQETYRIISDLYRDAFGIAATNVEDLESLNAGWLELVWYHLGQSGAGAGANGLLEKLNDQLRSGQGDTLGDGVRRLYNRRIKDWVRAGLEAAAAETWYLPKSAVGWLASQIDKRAPQILTRLVQKQLRERQAGASRMRYQPLEQPLAHQCWGYLDYLRTSTDELRGRKLSFAFGHTHVAGVWPERSPHLFNDGAWIYGPNGEWPNAHVMVCESDGALTLLPFPRRGEPGPLPQTFAFAPAQREPAAS